MKVLVKYPTRRRWPLFRVNFRRYVELADNLDEVSFLVSVDEDDPVPMDVMEMLQQFKATLDFGPHISKVSAINRAVPSNSWDVLVLAADDMRPVAVGWDEIIRRDMREHFPAGFGLLNYNVEPRLGSNWRDLVTFPVMGRSLYTLFGYIYHPSYVSEFCDNEMTEVCAKMDRLFHVDKRIVVHDWQSNRDDLTDHNIQRGLPDRANYEMRRSANFL